MGHVLPRVGVGAVRRDEHSHAGPQHVRRLGRRNVRYSNTAI